MRRLTRMTVPRTVTLVCVSLLSVACHRPKQYVTFDAKANRFTDVPAYIGTGDKVYLRVIDSVYAHKYASKVDTTTVISGDRAALYGAIDLTALTGGIPGFVRQATGLVGRLPGDTAAVQQLGVFNKGLRGVAAGQELDKLFRFYDTYRDSVTRACEPQLSRMSVFLASHPDEAALLSFLLNKDARALAHSIPAEAVGILAATSLDSARANTVSIKLADSLQRAAANFGRQLAVLGVYASPNPAFKPDRQKLMQELDTMATCLEKGPGLLARNVVFRVDSILRWNPSLDIEANQGRLDSLFVVAGLDVTPFVVTTSARRDQLRKFYDRLVLVNRTASLLAATANQLPRYAVARDTQEVSLGSFWRPVRLKITPVRGNRFPEFAQPRAMTLGATAPPAAGGGAAGTPAPGTVTQTLAVGAYTVNITAVPAPEKKDGAPALAMIEVDVLQRTRFHVGVGVLSSGMKSETFNIRPDTVDGVAGKSITVTGTSPHRYEPMVTLAYSVLPVAGKVFGAQAYSSDQPSCWGGISPYVCQMGLGATLGLSLQNPLEQVFVGLSTEPFPGLNIGFGRHYGYVAARSDTNSFVPESQGEPAPKRWLNGYAWSFTVDGAVLVGAFGKLVGLK